LSPSFLPIFPWQDGAIAFTQADNIFFRKYRQEFMPAPHHGGTISEILATEMLFYRIQIVAHYERGIAPGTNSLYLTEIEFLPALGTFQTIEI